MYSVNQIISELTPGSSNFTVLLIGFAVANAIGLLEYIWAIALTFKEKAGPFPMWMHTFFFAHDSTACVVFTMLAFKYHFFWVFTLYALGLLTWSILEIICMSIELKYNYKADFNVDRNQAILQTVFLIMIMYCIIWFVRYLDHDVAMFIWLPMTNFVMAIGPGQVLLKRQSRHGSSVVVYIFILLGTLFNFAPKGIGFFSTLLPQVFNNGLWTLVGVVATIIAIYNLWYILHLPAKTDSKIY